MIAKPKLKKTGAIKEPRRRSVSEGPGGLDVLVFVDPDLKDSAGLQHAQNVALAFRGGIELLGVMTQPTAGTIPIDPVDWDITKRTAKKSLGRLAKTLGRNGEHVVTKLLEGKCIDQITAYTEARKGDIAAVLRSHDEGRWRLSDTIHAVLNAHSAAILIIPEAAQRVTPQNYKRILVPIDGSTRSQSALPFAVTLAKAENAELLLCHVTPEPGLTKFGIMDSRAIELDSEVTKRNTRAGREHLNKILNSLAYHKIKVSTCIVPAGDARRAVMQTAKREGVDFLVMATHGQSGHSDVPIGDVASFILDQADIPVLMVRHHLNGTDNHATGNVTSAGVRQPTGTDI